MLLLLSFVDWISVTITRMSHCNSFSSVQLFAWPQGTQNPQTGGENILQSADEVCMLKCALSVRSIRDGGARHRSSIFFALSRLLHWKMQLNHPRSTVPWLHLISLDLS